MNDWLIWIGLTLAPLPGFFAYRWMLARHDARRVRDLMAERRARYGGAVKVPGRKVERIDR